MSSSEPIVVKVEDTTVVSSSSAAASSPTIVHATPVQSTPAVVYATTPQHQIPGEAGDIGICRKCRRQFRRPPGVNDGQAQYYRCQECDGERLQDILYSCVIA